jgi:hypothetical protein
MSAIDKIELPTWLNGVDAKALGNVAKKYWQTVESYLLWWLEQLDEEVAALPILDLLAWERGINRLDGESVELYSLRIKHAVANSEDAGFDIGMERIFKRLGFGYIEINSRVPTYDWDMVEVCLIEDEFVDKQALVEELIRQYGRTCRRYFLSVLNVIDAYVVGGLVEYDKEVVG